MLYFNADPRNNAVTSGSSCQTCCCESIGLRPGERNLLVINYAHWAMAFGGNGIVKGSLTFNVETNTDACPNCPIDNIAPPSNTQYDFTVAINTPLAETLSTSAAPANSFFCYKIIPMSGPCRGTVTMVESTGDFVYTPNPGFEGYDFFWFEMKDDYGRVVNRPVRIGIGNVTNCAKPREASALQPFLEPQKATYLSEYQEMRVPIYMPYVCTGCEVYRLTMSVKAQDCNHNIYSHQMCFDIRCKDC